MGNVNDILNPHFAQSPYGRDVVGAGEGVAQALRAMIFPVVIDRAVRGIRRVGEAHGDV
jgi:hypothetical protein